MHVCVWTIDHLALFQHKGSIVLTTYIHICINKGNVKYNNIDIRAVREKWKKRKFKSPLHTQSHNEKTQQNPICPSEKKTL